VGISYTEFAYQLMQGYDYYWLNENKNCKLQMGGSDQWGNITTGTELVRRKSGNEAFAFTCPLIKKADGTKFGKTESGNVWLDAERTTPYQFYQFWLNASDADAENWIKIFTFLSKAEVETLLTTHQENPAERLIQKKLAEEVTVLVHGSEKYELAVATTQKLFSKNADNDSELTLEDLQNIEGIVKADYEAAKIKEGINIVSLLAETGVFASKGEARKMVQGGGVSINRQKVDDIQVNITETHLLYEKYILVQKGKRNYYLIQVQ
jgi:tyrosyl-tRNA synthetase